MDCSAYVSQFYLVLEYGPSPTFPCWFCLDVLFIKESGVLKSPTIIVLSPTSPFSYVNVYFLYLGDLLLDAYIIVISS